MEQNINNINIAVMGAALDTSNLGVSALAYSILAQLKPLNSESITIFDHQTGENALPHESRCASGRVNRCGLWPSRRLYRKESLGNIRIALATGGKWNPAANRLRLATAILDISGGDSFTDLYGSHRFNYMLNQKKAALASGRPLILMPQTIGPFETKVARNEAIKVMKRAALIWARDVQSYARLEQLLGSSFDKKRHLLATDIAFGLEASEPFELSEELENWFLRYRLPGHEIIGVNPSGLIMNRPDIASSRYGITMDYHQCVVNFLKARLRENPRLGVMLVPHVMAPDGNPECDHDAARKVRDSFNAEDMARIVITPRLNDPRQAKWFIGQCEWFLGTRMHSTIAALSQGVPTVTLAYSPKAKGIFELCDQAEGVIQMKGMTLERAASQLENCWKGRYFSRAHLSDRLPAVKWKIDEQASKLRSFIRAISSSHGKPVQLVKSVQLAKPVQPAKSVHGAYVV